MPYYLYPDCDTSGMFSALMPSYMHEAFITQNSLFLRLASPGDFFRWPNDQCQPQSESRESL